MHIIVYLAALTTLIALPGMAGEKEEKRRQDAAKAWGEAQPGLPFKDDAEADLLCLPAPSAPPAPEQDEKEFAATQAPEASKISSPGSMVKVACNNSDEVDSAARRNALLFAGHWFWGHEHARGASRPVNSFINNPRSILLASLDIQK